MDQNLERFLEMLWLEEGLSVNTRKAYQSDLVAFSGWLQRVRSRGECCVRGSGVVASHCENVQTFVAGDEARPRVERVLVDDGGSWREIDRAVRSLPFSVSDASGSIAIDAEALEHFQPSAEQATILARDRDALVAHLIDAKG